MLISHTNKPLDKSISIQLIVIDILIVIMLHYYGGDNMNNDLLLRLRSSMQDLRPSEQKVASYVLDNYQEVKFQTVSEVAYNSDVSDATVMRFVKNLGFKGFQDFKLTLASLPAKKSSSEIKNISDEDSILDIKENIKNNFNVSINDTFSVLKRKSLKKAIKYILDAKEIFIVGSGASGIMARLLSYKLLRIGIIVKYVSDSHLQAMHASLLGPDKLVIGISHSGSTKDTVDPLKIAYEAKTTTICITDHVKSPIVKYSDVLLCTFAQEDPLGISQSRSSVSQVYVIETLAACLYAKIKTDADKARKKTAESVLEKLY